MHYYIFKINFEFRFLVSCLECITRIFHNSLVLTQK
nr:MAG TPA: hypothetical protein [Caudoviricetes sp.]